jgi:hypothetical protein
MDLTQLGLYTLALIVYPGALALLALGLVAETGASWALVHTNPVARFQAEVRRLSAVRALPPAASGAVLLTLMAATQLSAPFNPVPAAERNLLVAAAALAGAVWLAWPGGLADRRADARFLLAVQGGWLASLLAMAVATDTLQPQVIGAAAVGHLIPVKLAAALLYVLCLPGLLGLASRHPRSAQASARWLLWLPFCGLFASLFFPPGPDDLGSLARFVGAALLAALLAIAIAVPLTRSRSIVRGVYVAAVLVATAATLAIAVVTTALA